MKKKSIFDDLEINDPKKAFENAIKNGLENPSNWMYMYSKDNIDYFKNIDTRVYIEFNSK